LPRLPGSVERSQAASDTPFHLSLFNTWCLSVLLFALMTTNSGTTQSTAGDYIVFTTQPGWADLTECVQCYFACDLNITGDAGCGTNACLCKDSGLEIALDELLTGVLYDCQNTYDQQEATSFLLAYCSDKGYTDALMVSVSATLTGRFEDNGLASQRRRESSVAVMQLYATIRAEGTPVVQMSPPVQLRRPRTRSQAQRRLLLMLQTRTATEAPAIL
jgi:hypothetical protein